MCYLAICRAGYSKKMAFAFLEEIQREFQVAPPAPLDLLCIPASLFQPRLAQKTYGTEFTTVARPYAFIQFGLSLPSNRDQPLPHPPRAMLTAPARQTT